MDVKDEEAVARTLAGDREAFGILVEKYAGALAALAYDRLGDPQAAQEAAQETLVTAFAKLKDLRDAARFGAWVSEILRNACNLERRERKVGERGTGILADMRAGIRPPTPLEHVEEEERSRKLREAVAGLSASLREVIVLRYWGGVRRAEAAAILDIGLDALDKRLERALRELREKLTP